MLRKIRYYFEGLLGRAAFVLFLSLDFERASDVGGALLRAIGPYLPRTRVARNNLRRALPELTGGRLEEIITEMWENIGRFLGEFPHMGRIDKRRLADVMEIEGLEHLDTLRNLNKGSIFVSGHLGNWELACRAVALHDFPLLLVYRRGNNPALDNLIQRTRDHYQPDAIPKGPTGARQLVQAVKQGRHIGVLIDQKMNDGIPVPFFGRDAMTGPAIARLALRFDCPLVPGRMIRLRGHKQKLIIYPPLVINRTGDTERDVLAIMTRINAMLEDWIRDYPAQWLWIHNRWPKEVEVSSV
jgi:KDO2-lipid IV(A) lauroyltransferase